MLTLIMIELGKIWRLRSVRISLLLLALFPIVWSYAPGVIDVYGFYVLSAYQVPGLVLLSAMEFLMPLLVAVSSASLLGLELSNGTLPTILLRPVTRSQWLTAKLISAALLPFLMLFFTLIISLLVSFPFGYGPFVGGTGVGAGDIVGRGLMTPGMAIEELLRTYVLASLSLVPISCMAVLFTVIFRSGVSGALATIALLIFMRLLVVFPGLERFLLTTHLNAYASPTEGLGWVVMFLLLSSAVLAAAALVGFERKDF